MVRNIVVIGGTSHPQLTEAICNHLSIPPAKCLLSKFSGGETRVEVAESVRGKDVFIIQSGGGAVNDHLMELLITISACKTASAKRVTAVLPLFPYSRQADIPYNTSGAPRINLPPNMSDSFSFSRPQTPPGLDSSPTLNGGDRLSKQLDDIRNGTSYYPKPTVLPNGISRSNTLQSLQSDKSDPADVLDAAQKAVDGLDDLPISAAQAVKTLSFQPQRGYKQWVAQAGTLIADLLTCAGTDHVITMDLHDPQYQGFFDIPVDNLYGRNLLRNYIQLRIANYEEAIIVSPDAGGAKRATAIADALNMPFALIHKERRKNRSGDRHRAAMMLVGDVTAKTAILIDDLVDTANTITRAATLLKEEGATYVYALVTHGVLSGNAIERINESTIDKIVVTNSLAQELNQMKCLKLEVLEVGHIFAEAIRRVHHGESISVLFEHN